MNVSAVPSLSFDQARDLTGGKFGAVDAPCPLCGPQRRSVANRRRKTLRLWCADPGFISYHCARCGEQGWASNSDTARSAAPPVDLSAINAEVQRRDQDETRERLKVAMSLWRRRIPIDGTTAEIYLRQARCYGGRLPATLGFLPASGDYPPAMIAAFGLARETLPGEIVIDEGAIRGVHLTSLKPDGSGKAGTDRDKIMIGKSIGWPIVLAPINDGMGLAIAEGIEDALSLHEATGLGSWAAGSASRLPAVADRIPNYVETVSIAADADDIGLETANRLGQIILRTRECRVLVPA
jgi:Toprim domain